MKVRTLADVLAKRFGVAAAQELAPTHHDARRRRLPAGAPRLPGREARLQGRAACESRPIELRTLTDGGQPAEETAHALADFIAAAQHTLDIAIYDIRLPDPLAAIVLGALTGAATRGVAVRLAYNVDHPDRHAGAAAAAARIPALLESLPFPTAAIPGVPDLMHHKYVIRDAETVWTGSTNWTADSWTREENVIVTVDSPELAARYRRGLRAALDATRRREDRQGRHGPARRRRHEPSAPGSAPAAAKSSPTGSRRRSARPRAGSGSPRP